MNSEQLANELEMTQLELAATLAALRKAEARLREAENLLNMIYNNVEITQRKTPAYGQLEFMATTIYRYCVAYSQKHGIEEQPHD